MIVDAYAAPPHTPASPAPWMPTQHVEEGVTLTHTGNTHTQVDWRKTEKQAMDGKKEETGNSHKQTLMLRLIHEVFVKWTFFLHFTSNRKPEQQQPYNSF